MNPRIESGVGMRFAAESAAGATTSRIRSENRDRMRTRGVYNPESWLVRGHAQVAEVRLGAGADPQTDAAAGRTAFEVVHDQRRLRGAVDEQPRANAADLDPDVRPRAALEIGV